MCILGALIYSIYLAVTKFMEFGTNVKIETVSATSGGIIFPAVTFCNLNPIKVNSTQQYIALNEALLASETQTPPAVSGFTYRK